MCRNNVEGGRRCPSCYDRESRDRANEYKRNNRKAKKDLKLYLEKIGLEKTADKISEIRPSQIPDFMNAMGFSEKILSVPSPRTDNARKEYKDAKEFIRFAQKEKRSRNKKAREKRKQAAQSSFSVFNQK